MSSDSSPSHITNVAVLAWNVYEAYQQSVGDFKALSGEVLLLHSILRQAHEEFEKIALSGQQKRSLQLLISESEDLLKELLLNFESLPMSSRRTRDRMRGRSVDAGSIGIRINKQVTLLNTFHNFIVSGTSLPEMKSKLRALAQEYRNGSRDGSFMEPLTPATTGQDSHIGWSQLANDLEEVGIPRDVIKKNWGFFVAWLEEAMSNQSPEPERTPVLDRLWPDNNTEDPQEETEQKCTFCNSSYHDTAQHELFGSESLALTLTPSTVSDATSRSNSTNPSFFDRLGSNGYSIEVGFGGADPPKRLSPGTGNDVSSKNADRSIQHRRSSSDKRKDAKTKSRKSFLSTFGSSSPSLAQVRSPFGGESAMSINHVRPELGRISGEDVSIINESIR